MALLAEVRRLRRRPRRLPQCQQFPAWPRKSAVLRSLAEDMLREMAFVYKATSSIRDSMLKEAGGVVEQRQTDSAAERCSSIRRHCPPLSE